MTVSSTRTWLVKQSMVSPVRRQDADATEPCRLEVAQRITARLRGQQSAAARITPDHWATFARVVHLIERLSRLGAQCAYINWTTTSQMTHDRWMTRSGGIESANLEFCDYPAAQSEQKEIPNRRDA